MGSPRVDTEKQACWMAAALEGTPHGREVKGCEGAQVRTRKSEGKEGLESGWMSTLPVKSARQNASYAGPSGMGGLGKLRRGMTAFEPYCP